MPNDAPYEALRQRYRMSLGDKQSELALSWERWLGTPDSPKAKSDFHERVHKLAGSAQAYGYVDLGREAVRVDELLSRWDSEVTSLRAPLKELLGDIAARVEALLHVLSRASREAVPAMERGAGKPVTASSIFVLLVEDDPQQALYWREALTAEGLRVRSVDNTDAMDAQLVIEPPDVLLVDFWLPGQTGADLARHLRSTGDFARIPRVCLTADQGQLPRQVAMDSGFAAVLRKTVSPADLAQVLLTVARPQRG